MCSLKKEKFLNTYITALVWGLFLYGAFFMNKESQEYNFWTDQLKEYSIGGSYPHQEKIIAFLRDNFIKGTNCDPVIVDFGTFTGRNISALQGIGHDTTVIGTDIRGAESELKIARAENPRATFVETNLDAIAFQDQSIDGALCWRVLHNLSTLEKIQAALAEMHRVLKDNSPCIISVRSVTNISSYVLSGDPVRTTTSLPHSGERTDWYFTESSLATIMEQTGFTVASIEEIEEGERISGIEEMHKYLICYAIKSELQ